MQLRAKSLDDSSLLALCEDFVAVCRDRGVLGIINDRVDMAVLSGADGVHLGAGDLSAAQARRLERSAMIIGRTTHSLEQLEAVLGEPATYVSLGPVFATATKPHLEASGLEYLRAALTRLQDTAIAHVAIGGINSGNLDRVLAAGARAVAVCSAVSAAADPEAAARVLKDALPRVC
jgi:thiamine-phosphate pyrophosphorylase